MPEISFVFDRTSEDLSRAKELIDKVKNEGYASLSNEEKAEWDNGLKACRNASDLNRIGNAINIISSSLYAAGFIEREVQSRTDWGITDIPSYIDMEAMLGNIIYLRDAANKYGYYIHPVPYNPINTIEKMNLIERILYEVYNITNIILTDRQVCGEDYRCYSVEQVPDLDGRLI